MVYMGGKGEEGERVGRGRGCEEEEEEAEAEEKGGESSTSPDETR